MQPTSNCNLLLIFSTLFFAFLLVHCIWLFFNYGSNLLLSVDCWRSGEFVHLCHIFLSTFLFRFWIFFNTCIFYVPFWIIITILILTRDYKLFTIFSYLSHLQVESILQCVFLILTPLAPIIWIYGVLFSFHSLKNNYNNHIISTCTLAYSCRGTADNFT